MNVFRNPSWIKQFKKYHTSNDIPQSLFDEINRNLVEVLSDQAEVSVVVPAWNEEVNIINCIYSLSLAKSKFPFEIIVINNNSSDNTQKVLDKLLVKSYYQEVQGCGPARQLGQEKAIGKIILMADADCLYPSKWIQVMTENVRLKNVSCVYGRHSFIAKPGLPRWKLFLFEKSREVVSEFRHIKRPFLNAFGMNMGYIKEQGLRVGFTPHNVRGEDGRLCFDLMSEGEIRQVRHKEARVWTEPRRLERDGDLTKAFAVRVSKEFKRIFSLFKDLERHDTKTTYD